MDDWPKEVKQGNAVDFEIQWVEEKKQEQLMTLCGEWMEVISEINGGCFCWENHLTGWFGTWLLWLSRNSWECHHPNWLSLHHFSEGLGSTTNQLRNGRFSSTEGIPVDWFYVCRMIDPYYLVSWGVLQHGKAVQQPCRYPMFCLVCGYGKSYIEIIESDTPCGIFHDFFMTYPLVNVRIPMENHIFNR